MTAQSDMFAPPPPSPAPPAEPHALRPYQLEAVAAVQRELKENASTLLVAATGTGKTQMFCELINRTAGRVLVLAHRDELIQQAAKRIAQQTGRDVAIEKASEFAPPVADVVVGSVQTLCREDRRARWPTDHFDLVIVDEAHHSCAPSYRGVFDHFEGKLLGVTATPDRADRLALGAIFDSVAYVYDIQDAIRDGWLCPIRAVSVKVEHMDLADVHVVAGDLNQGELDAVMAAESVMHDIARPTLDLAGARRTLVFTTGVETAHRMAEIFCRYRPDCARAVDGGMDLGTRRRTLWDHQAGKFQFLINVGIATEGYDDPGIACVVNGRPTKSRSLYTQMVGRGTRIADGKADLLIVDLVGNTGRHSLVSAVDVLAGRHPDDVVARAKAIVAKEPGLLADEALERAEQEVDAEKARRAKLIRPVRYSAREVDPFRVLGVSPDSDEWSGQFGSKPPTDPQLAALERFRVPIPENITRRQASDLLDKLIGRSKHGFCNFAQATVLQRHGYDTKAIRVDEASRLISALRANNWRPLPRDTREPGEEG